MVARLIHSLLCCDIQSNVALKVSVSAYIIWLLFFIYFNVFVLLHIGPQTTRIIEFLDYSDMIFFHFYITQHSHLYIESSIRYIFELQHDSSIFVFICFNWHFILLKGLF